jgi:hypothetical protein
MRRTQKPPQEVMRHHLYGEIPLVREFCEGKNGSKTAAFFKKPDPLFSPALPPGAIRGDVSKQIFCSACHTPKYFYMDEKKSCFQCGRPFVFSAVEQKYWYETLRFNFHSSAIRCKDCRRTKRSDRMIQKRLTEASRVSVEFPRDPLAQIELAEATHAYHKRFGEGRLDRAIQACRTARRLAPKLIESLYWEAECLDALSLRNKSKILFSQFLELAGKQKRYRAFASKAIKALSIPEDNQCDSF